MCIRDSSTYHTASAPASASVATAAASRLDSRARATRVVVPRRPPPRATTRDDERGVLVGIDDVIDDERTTTTTRRRQAMTTKGRHRNPSSLTHSTRKFDDEPTSRRVVNPHTGSGLISHACDGIRRTVRGCSSIGRARASHARGTETVSYTHLTLPTILLV